MLVGRVHGCVDTKVDANAIAHYCLAIKGLSNGDSGLLVEKRYNDAAEGFEGCPCVNFCMRVDCLADLCKGGGLEDLRCEEVLDACQLCLL